MIPIRPFEVMLGKILPEIWPLALFIAVAMAVGVKRYRQTLD